MPDQHHKLGPSALKWIEICPGYRSEGGTSIFAEEGTRLHDACETGNVEGLDEEQLSMVTKCTDYISTLTVDATEVLLEQRLTIRLFDDNDTEDS